MDLQGRGGLVTGGASGIGEAVVREFVKSGARTVFLDVNQKQGQMLEAEIGRDGQCLFFPSDVSDESGCAGFVQRPKQPTQKTAPRRYPCEAVLAQDAAACMELAQNADWKRRRSEFLLLFTIGQTGASPSCRSWLLG